MIENEEMQYANIEPDDAPKFQYDPSGYWANSPIDQIGGELKMRTEKYFQFLRTCSLWELYQRAYVYYYRASVTSGQIVGLGDNAEYSGLFVNHLRNIAQNLLNLTVAQRPSFQCRATNSDYKSQVQAKLGNGLLDYYMREKRLERQIREAVESAVAVFGEAFVYTKWDAQSGKEYGTTGTGAIIREGDIEYSVYGSTNVIRDPVLKRFDDRNWLILRTFRNKYELAAQFPEKQTEIESLQYEYEYLIDDITDFTYQNTFVRDTDLIGVYEFFHEDDASCPGGRYVLYLQDETVLIDSPLPYKSIPIRRISAGDIKDLPFGYTVIWDLLPLQKSLDSVFSTIQTNQETFGVQNILLPRGANIGIEQIVGGLNVIEYDGQAVPSAFAPLATPGEVYNFLPTLVQTMELLSGINSVIRGQPEASLQSGAALALIASQAYQSSLLLQTSYIQLIEDVGTDTINILKEYAKTPRVAQISGISNRTYMQEFTGNDLSEINRVIVDVGNPLANSISGRLELATNYMNIPPEFRDQWAQILSTGRLENMVEGQTTELLLIKAENEKMQSGETTPVLVTDNHRLHIQEHKSILASPESRVNPEVVQTVLAHLQEHINFLKTGDPDLLALTGSQPLGNAQAPQPPGIMNAQPGFQQQAGQVQMPELPNMPINPLTQTPFQPGQPPVGGA